MNPRDDFRFDAHTHLVSLDATTNHLMMLVVKGDVSGPRWSEAVSLHKLAFEKWADFVARAPVSSKLALDRHSATENLPNAD